MGEAEAEGDMSLPVPSDLSAGGLGLEEEPLIVG
jgi:hypothetical protein